jgi:hypothetical protein
MPRLTHLFPALGLFFFASFSASTNYQLNSYGINAGGTNNSQDGTYTLQGAAGEQANGTTNSTTYTAKNGSVQTYQLSVPGAPTLSINNGYYNYYSQINCIVNITNEPTDATYAIRVSPSPFSTNYYVQVGGALGPTPVYQSYSAWNSGSGVLITGLSSNTSYNVNVAAKQGTFTNTEYGAVANISTGSPSITFSVTPSSYNFGSFLPSVITTSSNLSFTYATNGIAGGDIYVIGKNNGFYSPSKSYTIPAYSGNLTGTTQGFGIQATNPNQTIGGPLTTVSPFAGTGNTVGAESTSLQPIFATANAIAGGTANANVQVKAAGNAPPATDYTETFTFVAAASF